MPLLDLSAAIVPSSPDTPEPLRTEIARSDHAAGADAIQALFQVPPRLLRGSEGWATEELVRFGTHNSTHVDAPWHYNSTIQAKPAQTIDELPLEWFFSDAVVLDMSAKEDGDAVTVADLERELDRIGYELKELDIALVRTGRDAFYAEPDYIARGPGVTADATRWLYERGVRVMGIDAWGWDAPLHLQAKQALERDRPGIFWAAHQCDLAYSQIERLVGLDALPPVGFKVACFPLKVVGGSAGPARVVAILPD